MADDKVPPLEIRQRHINDDAAVENANESIHILGLGDGILSHLASFLGPVDEATLACKAFFEAVTRASESALRRIEKDYHDEDPDWMGRLAEQLLGYYRRFYFGGTATRPIPKLHPHLLLRVAHQFPLTQLGEFTQRSLLCVACVM